jgi:8-oxo-dGTP pyrophosphatase MutT (NUDIX family)
LSIDRIRGCFAGRAPLARAEDPFAAVAAVFVPGDPEPELLFIQRATREGDHWSGHMAFPGGRRHAEDRDLLATALRETSEETGICLDEAALLGELPDVSPLSMSHLRVRPFVFALPAKPAVVPNHEVAGHLWIGLGGLKCVDGTAQVDIPGGRITVPAYTCGAYVIWGFTRRVVNLLEEIVKL